jgi:predicted KAP-like P-loop ATPase
MVVGIYGPWGSGKTTLMEAIIAKLDALNEKGDTQLRRCKTVRFQAWKYAGEDEILAALIERILQTMKQDGFFESCKAKVEELVARFNLTKKLGVKSTFDFC